MKRTRIYVGIINWLSPVLLVLVWLQLLSGLGSFKGDALRMVTLGLLDPANASKLHTVNLPLALGVLAYVHATMGLQLMGRRLKWVRNKAAWEIAVFALGGLFLIQFLLLYFA